jgi:acetolactate synthase I/II/III large subunit
MNVAEAIAAICRAEGVRLVAGIWGQSATHISKALADMPGMKLYYGRQERVLVDICDGFARVSGQPAVLFTDAGPAAANAMGGIVNSWGDSVPILFFAAHNDRFDIRRRATKELPVVEIFGPVSKWAAVMTDPSQVESMMRRAFTMLRAPRSGPVVIGLPHDVSGMDAATPSYVPMAEPVRSAGNPADIERAVMMLAAAERPYVYVGVGVLTSSASNELVALAELLTLPVATTLNGKSAFPENHALALGIGGFSRALYSTLQAERFADEADVVLTVGCGFKKHATREPMPGATKHIQVDVDPEELHRESHAEIAILGDAKVVLRQMVVAAERLIPKSRLQPRSEVMQRIQALRDRWWAISRPMLMSAERPVNPFRVTWEFSQLVNPDDTIVLHDAGGTRGTTCQHYVATVPRSFVAFGVESAMGWSLGAAIGAKAAAPEKLVATFIGDEAFCETAMDLETSVLFDTPILVILLNNRGDTLAKRGKEALNRARWDGGRRLSDVAKALGADAAYVDEPEQVRPALERAIAMVRGGRTSVVEVEIARVRHSITYLYGEQQESNRAPLGQAGKSVPIEVS